MASREFGSEINQDNLANVEAESSAAAAPTGVAHLRNFLDEFGRKNKEHFEKSLATSASADVQKSPVRRPKVRRSVESGPTPLPNEAASVLVRRIMKPAGTASAIAHAATTNKYKKVDPEIKKEVEATNEGYASVEKLCKWLADDPTSTKKVRHLRRGANVLAKSRAFDKGLANAIAVEHKIKHGSVSQQKKHFERRDTIGAPTVRKTWKVTKSSAASDIGTRKDDGLAKAEAAKQQWRDRIQQPKKENPVDVVVAVTDTNEIDNEEEEDDERSEVGSNVTEVAKGPTNSSELLDRIITENDHDNDVSVFLDTPSECSQATVEARQPLTFSSGPSFSSSDSMDFRQVRELLVKRSESNGSADEVVQSRKKKFEKLQKDMRRKTGTHGLLKASWDVEEGSYVKKYVSDIPPKRSLHELP